jgi:excisionase family DNA binding protein
MPTRKSKSGAVTPAQPLVTPDVMTIEELALYLKLAVATLYRKVQDREIPFTKVGNLLRFTKVSIDRWLARNTTTPQDSLYEQFARLQNRYHFQKWLEGRGVDWRELTDAQLADLASKALLELRDAPPEA